jgi:hypothetical protein
MRHLWGDFTVSFNNACFCAGDALGFIPDPMPTPALLTKRLHFLVNSTSRQLITTLKQAAVGVVALPSLAVALSAPAHANLVTNGGFVPVPSIGTAKSGLLSVNSTNIPGWTPKAYNTIGLGFWGGVVGDGTAISIDLDQALWAGNTGVRHYMNVPNVTSVSSVDGSGWFLNIDSDPRFGNTMEQTVNGLIPGHTYELSFSQAAGQYAPDPDLQITSWWRVGFGSSPLVDSAIMTVAAGDPISAWQSQTMTFTATSTSQLLSFLAQGTPVGGPPFSLLSGVSLTDTTTTSVPGPLPVLGVAAAFGASRKLRRRNPLG